jgi:hypothetical protein
MSTVLDVVAVLAWGCDSARFLWKIDPSLFKSGIMAMALSPLH